MSLPKPYYSDDYATIYHGDCREILPHLPKVDLVLTSPPYDQLREYGGHEWGFEATLQGLCSCSKPGTTAVWITADQTIDGSETCSSFKHAIAFVCQGWKLWDTMIWDKGVQTTPTESRYYNTFEYMFVFSMGRPTHMNFIEDRLNVTAGSHRTSLKNCRKEKRVYGGRKFITKPYGRRFNVWRINPHSEPVAHPAIFPTLLATGHIRTWSGDNSLILDPFMGSGTTLRAAKDLGRKAIGIEIEEKYCEIASKRLAQEVMGI